MNTKTKRWLYGLGATAIGGGASAVTSGITSMGFAPDKFNLANVSGVWHLLGLMAANFIVSGLLSVMFYLRQSPLPPESSGNSDPSLFIKPPGAGAAIIIALFLLGAASSSRGADFTNTITLRALAASTNDAFIPFVKYDTTSHKMGYGAAALYKVSDNFWTGLRLDQIDGRQTTAGVQAQLQQTFQLNSFTFTPFIEASVGLGSSSLYGSAGPGTFVHLFHKDFTIQGHRARLNFEIIGDYEHVIYNGHKSNQANGGPIIELEF